MKLFFVDKKFVFGLGFLIVALIICGFCSLMSVTTGTDSKNVPIYCVKTDEKKVAITFDSAWGNEDLPQIMEALGKYECKATFFVVGDFLNKYAEDVKNMHKNGHEIANHSDTHAHMNSLSREEMIAEMDGCDNKIKNLTGQKEVLFRAPYGEYNNLLVQTCKDTGRFCIQWDCDLPATVGLERTYCVRDKGKGCKKGYKRVDCAFAQWCGSHGRGFAIDT